jgi:SSS family solute:Na+ symporter
MAHYELHAWCLLVLAWVFVPFYMRSMVFTMPEFLERRYSPAARTVLSLISLIAYVFTKIAVGLFAGGIVFTTLFPNVTFGGINSFWIGCVIVLVFTGVYTMLGGLRAVAYTDTVQAIILIIGSALVTYYGLKALGGWGEMREIAALPKDYFDLWRPLQDPSGEVPWYYNDNFPWLGMLFCAPIIGLWYWCTDQYIVQRLLGAPNETQARRGAIAAGFLKLSPVFLFIIPGMICYALAVTDAVPGLSALVSVGPDGQPVPDTGEAQAAFPLMVINLLPPYVRGIVFAGLLAALMSSLAGVFNASSTLFTMDIYQKIKKGATQHQLVWMGRLVTGILILVGIAWIPVIQGQRGLYFYLQAVQGYLAPPIFAVFFFGVFFKRVNGKGCLAALIGGFILGAFRLGIDTYATYMGEGFSFTEGTFIYFCGNLYFQYYSLIVFLVSVALLFVVSYMSAPQSDEQLQGLTYGTTVAEDRERSRASWGWPEVAASAVVLLIILAVYIYFRG